MKINFFSLSRHNAVFAIALVLAFVAASCGEPKFKVDGDIADGADKNVVLEKADFSGRWMVLDSVRTDKSGKFSFSADAPAAPEIYRVTFDGNYIYFPVDSVENIKIETTAKDFGHKFTVSGTTQAELMAEFEQALLRLDVNDKSKVDAFKTEVFNNYLRDMQGSILGYYVLTKTVGGKPLYNPSDKNDAKYFAAVATSFDQFRPNDPHGKVIKEIAMESMRQKNRAEGKQNILNAEEITVIDMELPDEKGVNHKLSDLVKNGKPTLVIFATMTSKESPDFNRALSDIYSRFGSRVNFYHVSVDPDQYAWRDAASNLPWLTVFDPKGLQSENLGKYNVVRIPVFYIYNASGELSDRADSIEELNTKLSKF